MIKKDNYFTSEDKVTPIHFVEYLPKCAPKATLLVGHGIGEHAGRYEKMAKYFTDHGVAVYAIDFIGHGKSVSAEKKPMYFGENGWDFLVCDLISLNKLVKRKNPNVPCFALGFSMGSFVLRTALAERKNDISVDGAILAGTGKISPMVANLVKVMVSKEAEKCGGPDNVSEKVNELAFGNYNKHFKPCKTEYDWLCEDPRGIESYINDPLTNKFVTPGMFSDLLDGMARTSRKEAIRNSKKVPMLFISGKEDPVGGFAQDVEKISDEYVKTNEDVWLQTYRNSRHDIFHDTERKAVIEDMYGWMKEVMAS